MISQSDTLPAGTSCLTPERVLSFAGGRSSDSERRELDLHIDRCSDCQQLVAAAIEALCPEHPPKNPDVCLAERYLLLRAIGRGGMGEVFDAFDQVLQERIALKVLSGNLRGSERAVRHFKAEVQLARRIAHPNVCRVFDLGVHEGPGVPLYFITMELIEGETLRQRLQAGLLPLERVAEWTRELAQGLQAAHLAGVLHRDLKSDNVLLRAGSSAVITDFGLARSLSDEHASLGRQLVGSAAYMAPEQVRGEALSPATDIYALGVVLFEMLTGSLPFRGATPFATAFLRLTEAAPAPSRLRPALPAGWDALVARCLARQPRARFESARCVLDVLDQLERGARPEPRRAPIAVVALCAALGLQPTASEPPELPTFAARRTEERSPIAAADRCEESAALPAPVRSAPLAATLPPPVRQVRRARPLVKNRELPPSPAAAHVESVDALIDPFQ